jgi:hypothetical protein
LSNVVFAFVLEQHVLREPTAGRLRAKGQDPRQAAALIGSVLMLAPVCWALFACFLGLPVMLLVCFAAISFVGIAFWGWRYRQVIYAA